MPCTTVLIRCNWARGFWHSSRRSTFDLLLLDLFHCPNFARSFFGLVALCWLFSLCFCLVVPVAWVWVLCRFAIVLSLLLCCAACCVDFQCAVLRGQSCAWFFGTKQTNKERKKRDDGDEWLCGMSSVSVCDLAGCGCVARGVLVRLNGVCVLVDCARCADALLPGGAVPHALPDALLGNPVEQSCGQNNRKIYRQKFKEWQRFFAAKYFSVE